MTEPAGDQFLLRAVAFGADDSAAALRLLVTAGRSRPHVLAWAEDGCVFALHDPAGGPGEGPAAAALTLPVGSGTTVELRVMAGGARWRHQEVELRLLEELADMMREHGVRRMVAGVGDGELDRVAVLARAGFRMTYVEHDACTPERGWATAAGRRPNRDLLWFQLEL